MQMYYPNDRQCQQVDGINQLGIIRRQIDMMSNQLDMLHKQVNKSLELSQYDQDMNLHLQQIAQLIQEHQSTVDLQILQNADQKINAILQIILRQQNDVHKIKYNQLRLLQSQQNNSSNFIQPDLHTKYHLQYPNQSQSIPPSIATPLIIYQTQNPVLSQNQQQGQFIQGSLISNDLKNSQNHYFNQNINHEDYEDSKKLQKHFNQCNLSNSQFELPQQNNMLQNQTRQDQFMQNRNFNGKNDYFLQENISFEQQVKQPTQLNTLLNKGKNNNDSYFKQFDQQRIVINYSPQHLLQQQLFEQQSQQLLCISQQHPIPQHQLNLQNNSQICQNIIPKNEAQNIPNQMKQDFILKQEFDERIKNTNFEINKENSNIIPNIQSPSYPINYCPSIAIIPEQTLKSNNTSCANNYSPSNLNTNLTTDSNNNITNNTNFQKPAVIMNKNINQQFDQYSSFYPTHTSNTFQQNNNSPNNITERIIKSPYQQESQQYSQSDCQQQNYFNYACNQGNLTIDQMKEVDNQQNQIQNDQQNSQQEIKLQENTLQEVKPKSNNNNNINKKDKNSVSQSVYIKKSNNVDNVINIKRLCDNNDMKDNSNQNNNNEITTNQINKISTISNQNSNCELTNVISQVQQIKNNDNSKEKEDEEEEVSGKDGKNYSESEKIYFDREDVELDNQETNSQEESPNLNQESKKNKIIKKKIRNYDTRNVIKNVFGLLIKYLRCIQIPQDKLQWGSAQTDFREYLKKQKFDNVESSRSFLQNYPIVNSLEEIEDQRICSDLKLRLQNGCQFPLEEQIQRINYFNSLFRRYSMKYLTTIIPQVIENNALFIQKDSIQRFTLILLTYIRDPSKYLRIQC